MILRNPRLKEVLFLLEVHDFAHPWKWIFCTGIKLLEADLGAAAVADEFQVFVELRGIEAEHAAGHGVVGVLDFEAGGFVQHVGDFLLELRRPQVRVFDLDLVDHVDAEVHVHGFVAHDVLNLFAHTHHLVAAAEAEQLHEADVEEDALEHHIEGDEVAQ